MFVYKTFIKTFCTHFQSIQHINIQMDAKFRRAGRFEQFCVSLPNFDIVGREEAESSMTLANPPAVVHLATQGQYRQGH